MPSRDVPGHRAEEVREKLKFVLQSTDGLGGFSIPCFGFSGLHTINGRAGLTSYKRKRKPQTPTS